MPASYVVTLTPLFQATITVNEMNKQRTVENWPLAT